jgi:hypothetical protein
MCQIGASADCCFLQTCCRNASRHGDELSLITASRGTWTCFHPGEKPTRFATLSAIHTADSTTVSVITTSVAELPAQLGEKIHHGAHPGGADEIAGSAASGGAPVEP